MDAPEQTLSLLAHAELRAFIAAGALSSLAESAFTVLLGLHVYELTHQALALGLLGLCEAVPAISLVLIGGHIADRVSRRFVVMATRLTLAALAIILAVFARHSHVDLLYVIAFFGGGVRAFDDPASTGLEAAILPKARLMNAVSLVASSQRVFGLAGPVLGGIAYQAIGPELTFAGVAALLVLSAGTLFAGIKRRPPPIPAHDNLLAAVGEGLRYVFASQVIIGSMMLDLFAVFFGGVTGLLPLFALDILHVGPAWVGLLRGASSVGGLISMLVTTRHPPRAHAGIALLTAVTGFGIGIIVFAFSRNLYVSLAALAVAGACDATSVVVRRAIVRIAAPDEMRGRVAAVRGLFLSTSNELGAFESGVLANWVGAVPAVWIGGVITLAVVAVTAATAPKLRRLDLTRPEFD